MAEAGKELTLKIIFDTLLEMRTHRWGLIQTEQQLKFSVDAIIAGLKSTDLVNGHNNGCDKQSNHHTNGKRLKEDKESDDNTDNEESEGQSKSKKRKNSES